ncbi:MAG: peptidylprolyl isomerase [Capnocytophaga sp.]|nr:peptidylprolyl isomerase [Capnocytophaga sp.]
MKHSILIFLLLLSGVSFAQKVVIKTNKGDIIVKLFPKKAPKTVANFLKYVDEKQYDNQTFYRVVRLDNQSQSPIPIEVIQGGVYNDTLNAHPPIEIETTKQTGLSHKIGAISMARTTPNSATSEFFIVLNQHQPQLDYGGKRNPDGYGFAVFGKVAKGMDVVKEIQKGETVLWEGYGQKQLLKEPVKIISIHQLKH